MCSWAHYSPGVARGGSFTSFTCSCCGYSPTEAEWRADLEAWHLLSDEEQELRQKQHRDTDDPDNQQKKHYHQVQPSPACHLFPISSPPSKMQVQEGTCNTSGATRRVQKPSAGS